MVVWAQQKLAFWEELERNGFAYCTEESSLYKDCRYAYDWLVQQMHTRLSLPPMPEIKLPLWCWVQYSCRKRRKPKFTPSKDEQGHYAEVFIEADIPDELLLQSNFHLWAWHCMNGWQIGDEQLAREINEYTYSTFSQLPFISHRTPTTHHKELGVHIRPGLSQ